MYNPLSQTILTRSFQEKISTNLLILQNQDLLQEYLKVTLLNTTRS